MIRTGLVYSNFCNFISDKWRQIDLTFDISHGCEAGLTPVGRLWWRCRWWLVCRRCDADL